MYINQQTSNQKVLRLQQLNQPSLSRDPTVPNLNNNEGTAAIYNNNNSINLDKAISSIRSRRNRNLNSKEPEVLKGGPIVKGLSNNSS